MPNRNILHKYITTYLLIWPLQPVTGLVLSKITTPYIRSYCSLEPILETRRWYIFSHLDGPTLSRQSYSATFTTWLRFEDFTNWVGATNTKNRTQPSKTLNFNTHYYVDVIVFIVQLLVPSYEPFSYIAERSKNLT